MRILPAILMLALAGDCFAQVDVSIRDELPTTNAADDMISCPLGAKKRVTAVTYGDLYTDDEDLPPALFPAAFVPPKLLEPPKVSYPLDLWVQKVEGFVSVAVRVDEKGGVSDPKIVCSSAAGFEVAALDAVMTLKYAPATLAGKAVVGFGIQPFAFTLR